MAKTWVKPLKDMTLPHLELTLLKTEGRYFEKISKSDITRPKVEGFKK
jgi:hypothetical protein